MSLKVIPDSNFASRSNLHNAAVPARENAAVSGRPWKKSADFHSAWSAASSLSVQPSAWSACQVALNAMVAQAKRTKCETSAGSGFHAVTSRVSASKFVRAAAGLPSCSSSMARWPSVCTRFFSTAQWRNSMWVP